MKTRKIFQPLFLLMLLVAAGGLTNRAHAQYQSFFGDSITEYSITCDEVNYCSEYGPMWLGVGSYLFKIYKKDTVTINGIRYYHSCEYSPAWYVYLREDTAFGRIYRYAQEGEILICDMSLSVGDTFFVPFSDMSFYAGIREPLPIIADTIFYINGLKHIQFRTLYEMTNVYLDDYGNPDTVVVPIPCLQGVEKHRNPIMFIEGIGSNFGPEGANWGNGCGGSWFENGEMEVWCNPFLLCVHKDGELVFMSDERAGCSQFGPAGVKDNNDIHFSLYPNPVRNILNVEFENMLSQKGVLYITDMVGRVVYSQKTAEQHLKVNVKQLQSGFYVATWICGGKKQSVKFVKK